MARYALQPLEYPLEQGAAIKTLIVALVIAACHAPIAWTARVSFAGTVDEPGDRADVRVGVTMDGRIPGMHQLEPGRDSTRAGPAQPGTFDAERHTDPALGISFSIQGVAFTVDEAVVRSYRTGLTNDAASAEDDLPASAGDSRDSLPAARKIISASSNFHDHMQSVAVSKFLSPQLLQVDEWDERDFKPPEWVGKLRDVVRDGGFAERVSDTSHPDAVDSKSWIKESLNFLTYIQKQFHAIDPLIVAILGIISFPFALLGFARTMRDPGAPPSHAVRIRKKSSSRPATRIRRSRRQTQSLRGNARP